MFTCQVRIRECIWRGTSFRHSPLSVRPSSVPAPALDTAAKRLRINRGMRGRRWTDADRTAGQIDDVFNRLRKQVPGLIIERLNVTHAADDNVYFLGDRDPADRVLVDTEPGGYPSFW